MAFVIQGEHNDCVIVSIANLTGIDYDKVMASAELFGRPKEQVLAFGTPNAIIPLMIYNLTGKTAILKKPRRGQDKLTGLAAWHRPNALNGHMTVIMDGNVINTNGRIHSIEEYRQITGYVLRGVYVW